MASRQLRFNKATFFEDVGYVPHEGQLAVHHSTAPRRIVACGVRWGKTVCAAMESLAAAMEPGENRIGWICAPTYDLAERVFREVVATATTKLALRVVRIKESERRLILRNTSGGTCEIRAKSADNPVSLLGEGLDFLIVDEAARLKPGIWQSHLSQRLVDKQGWALLISTPHGKGYFYDLFRRGQSEDDSDFASWNAPSWENPLLDRELIDKEQDNLPEQVFREQYGAEFLEGAGAVFRGVRECATGSLAAPVPGVRYFAGLDLARIEDYTVLVIVNRWCEVVYVDRFHRVDWQLQTKRVVEATRRYNDALTFCDSTGLGEPVFEHLVAEGCDARAYPFSAKSKSALINNLAMAFEKKAITLPLPEEWPQGIDELEAFEYSVTDAGNVRTGAPAGYHDDCVIALALAAWGPRPRLRERAFSIRCRNRHEARRILRSPTVQRVLRRGRAAMR